MRPGSPLAGLAPPWTGPGEEPGAWARSLPEAPDDAPARLRAGVVLVLAGPEQGTVSDALLPRLQASGIGDVRLVDPASTARDGLVDPVDLVVDLMAEPDADLADRTASVGRPTLWGTTCGGQVRSALSWPGHGPCRPCADRPQRGRSVVPAPEPPEVAGLEWLAGVLTDRTVRVLAGIGVVDPQIVLRAEDRRPLRVEPGCRRCAGEGVPDRPGPADPGSDASTPVRTAADVAVGVVTLVHRIPSGSVLSYGDIARLLGIGSARQVGQIMAAGVGDAPWWRVVRADGGLPPGLVSEAGERLRREATPMRTPGRVDMRTARWDGTGVGAV